MSIPIYDFYRINFPETPEFTLQIITVTHTITQNYKKRPEAYTTAERMYNAIYI